MLFDPFDSLRLASTRRKINNNLIGVRVSEDQSKPDSLYPSMQGSNEMIMTVFLNYDGFNAFADVQTLESSSSSHLVCSLIIA